MLLVATVSGCSSSLSSKALTPDSTVQLTTDGAAESSVSLPTDPVGYREWTILGTASSGETVQVTVDAGELVKADRVPAFDNRTGLSACTVDKYRDGVIPIRITYKNTTSGFPVHAEIGLLTAPSLPDLDRFWGDNEYSPGNTDCRQTGQIISVKWLDDLAPMQTVSTAQYIVVRDVYSPNQPDGVVPAIALGPAFTFTGQYSITSGPSVSYAGRHYLSY